MPRKKSPSRAKVSYPAIPREYAEMLRRLTAEGGPHEGRSMAFLVKCAVKAYLQAEGVLDAKGKPVEGG